MSYFVSDVKKIYKNRLVQITLLLMGIVAISDSLFVRFVYGGQPGFSEQVGANPFQFWLLMNSSGWGHTVYRTLLFVFPVLSTGLIFINERKTSIYELLIVRKSRTQYLISKIATVFIVTLFNFLLIFIVNLIVTNLCFSADAPLTEQYNFLVPKEGSLARNLYQIGPIMMELAYSFLNALAIALMSVLVLGIHMIFRFQNRLIAFLAPFLILYVVNYAEGLLLANYMQYNLSIIIQPRAASALSTCITTADVVLVFASLFAVDVIVAFIGCRRNRDAL